MTLTYFSISFLKKTISKRAGNFQKQGYSNHQNAIQRIAFSLRLSLYSCSCIYTVLHSFGFHKWDCFLRCGWNQGKPSLVIFDRPKIQKVDIMYQSRWHLKTSIRKYGLFPIISNRQNVQHEKTPERSLTC